MKKIILLLIIPLFCGTGHAMGKKAPEGVSLLLVPARPAMIQLGMDMATQEHALLMSYAPGTATDQLYLHIWNGSQWMRIPQASYVNGSFIKNPASRLLVVGDENDLTATLIETAFSWSPEVLHLGSDDITELINQMGRLYGFKKADWEWIAQRYALQLEDLNRDRVQTSWYDQNTASSLPPDEKPWKKSQENTPLQTPETSLSPVMPPVVIPPVSENSRGEEAVVAEKPEVTEEVVEVDEVVIVAEEVTVVEEVSEVEIEVPEPATEPATDFSLEVE
ncbi:hypothetical protein P0Y35_00645 [Kiritimatiellaeota bacterium B1221]|nr:hypothetical protein [Kiritimatiellaeota bacterium B1221]